MNKKEFYKDIGYLLLLVGVFYFLPSIAKADVADNLEGIVAAINETITTIGTVIVVIGWAVAGILYLTASGSSSRMGLAKTAMVGSIIGTILIVLSNVAEDIIAGLFTRQ